MKEITPDEQKHVLLNMLTEFHEICSNNGFRYFITGGTLLGAVRHRGFIPWDDDIDILMPRSDYQKLLALSSTLFNSSDLSIIDIYSTPNYIYPFAKLVNTGTIAEENVDSKQKFGLWIDIFPLDNMSDDYDKAVKLFNKPNLLKKILTIKNIRQSKDRSITKTIVLAIGKLITSIVSRHRLLLTIDHVCRKYESSTMTKYVSVVTVGTYGIKEIIDSSNYDDVIQLEFEGRMFNAPIGYKNILSNLYGDYMKLPPKEKQVTHHSFRPFWLN